MSHTEEGVALGFKQLEQEGWDAKAQSYDDLLGQVTRSAASPLLDAVKLVPGMRILDVATGPGYVAVDAAARGAEAVGIDFAPEMAALAGRLNPGLDFRQGDAEHLDFADASFDAVVCAFGVLHFADP
ncbi:MAG: class I SAM-dependent methyltransferase [Devosia sp.]|nr:class I SAM-dependent methyltransferase [Devosia sp.]